MKKGRRLLSQFFRFGIVGIICFVVDYALLILLTELTGLTYIVASGISFVVSVILNYILSMKFVFNAKEKMSKAAQIAIYVVLSLIGLLFTELIMWIAVETFGFFYAFAKWLSTTIVTVYNFVSRKIFLE